MDILNFSHRILCSNHMGSLQQFCTKHSNIMLYLLKLCSCCVTLNVSTSGRQADSITSERVAHMKIVVGSKVQDWRIGVNFSVGALEFLQRASRSI